MSRKLCVQCVYSIWPTLWNFDSTILCRIVVNGSGVQEDEAGKTSQTRLSGRAMDFAMLVDYSRIDSLESLQCEDPKETGKN